MNIEQFQQQCIHESLSSQQRLHILKKHSLTKEAYNEILDFFYQYGDDIPELHKDELAYVLTGCDLKEYAIQSKAQHLCYRLDPPESEEIKGLLFQLLNRKKFRQNMYFIIFLTFAISIPATLIWQSIFGWLIEKYPSPAEKVIEEQTFD